MATTNATNATEPSGKALYAATGAVVWAVDQMRCSAEQVAEWVREPQDLADRANDVYEDLVERGEHALGRARGAARQEAANLAQEARKQPGVAQAEGELGGAFAASESDLPIAEYDTLNVSQITDRLPYLSQRELGRVDGYERRHRARVTILDKVDQLRGQEPWPGYDEMSVADVLPRLRRADSAGQTAVAEYEAAHKNRSSVLEQTRRGQD